MKRKKGFRCSNCGHKKAKHDLAIQEKDNIGRVCLVKGCKCKVFKDKSQ